MASGGDSSDGSLAGRRVLLGITGGVAGYKAVLLARLLIKDGAEVQALMTANATKFVGLRSSFSTSSKNRWVSLSIEYLSMSSYSG